jgi:hypothetical protein
VRIRHTPLSRHRVLEALAGHDVGRRSSPLPMSTSYGEGATIAVTAAPQGPEAAEERGGEGGQV